MKSISNILVAVVIVSMTSCSNEEFADNKYNGFIEKKPMTFTAKNQQSRTSLDEDNLGVNWTKDDLVAIFDGANKNKFIASKVEGSIATITGEAVPTDIYTAFYPYTDDESLSFSNNTISFNLPSVQTAVAGSFAEDLNPSWAQTVIGSTDLQFKNLCALVKLTIGEDMAGEGTITLVGGNTNESLSGSFSYDISNNILSTTDDSQSRVSVSGNFMANHTYYIVVAPTVLNNGFSLLYEDGMSKLYRRATTKSVTLKAGFILNLGELNLSEGFEKAITAGIYTGTENVNADGTVVLSESDLHDMASKTSLNVNFNHLTTLAGIGYYSGLEILECDNNNLTTLDVSGLTELKTLCCRFNGLTSLDASNLTKLTELRCNDCQLTSLNVSGLTELTTLSCEANNLTTLDISGLSKLTEVYCDRNKLTTLNVEGLNLLISLRCNDNQLTSLPVSEMPVIEVLTCGNNKFTELDVSMLNNLRMFSCGNCSLTDLNISGLTNLSNLECSNNQLTKLDISELSKLSFLACNDNQLTELEVGGLVELTELRCNNNQLTELNISELTRLWMLTCNNNKLTELDLTKLSNWIMSLECGNQQNSNSNTLTLYLTSEQKEQWDREWSRSPNNENVIVFDGSVDAITNTAFVEAVGDQVAWTKEINGSVILTDENKAKIESVTYLDVKNKGLTDLSGIEYFTGLTDLRCYSNNLTSLDVSKLTKLTRLWCGGNQLTELNVDGLTMLSNFDCGDNQLTELEVSGLTNLTILRCDGNKLTSLNLRDLDNLTELTCENNQLVSLDVRNLTGLEELYCNNNKLVTLNVSGLPKLYIVDCNNNHLTSIDVSNVPALDYLNCSYNQLSSLSITDLTKLAQLDCSFNKLTSLNLIGLTFLSRLDCKNNQLTNLNIKDLNQLGMLYCSNNLLTTLDITRLSNLMELHCYANRLTELDITGISDFIMGLECGKQQTTEGGMQQLTLYLKSEHEDMWNGEWGWGNRPNNENVTIVVK